MSASVVPFPCRRRIGPARKIAAKSLTESWATGKAYDNRIRESIRKTLSAAGIDAGTIEDELSDFTETVVDEIQRQIREAPRGREDCA